MAEYRIRFTADSSAADRSISSLKKAIAAVTKEFEKAEIGADEFVKTASDLSRLKKELGDAQSAVVNVDKAYQSLNKAIDANFAVAAKAGKAAEDYNKKLLGLVEEQLKAEDQARRKNFQAEVDDWDKRFNLAVASSKKIAEKQRAIMEFRAGMGARGAIPGIASPIRGTAEIQGSPAYYEAINKAAKEAQGSAEKAQQALDKASNQAAAIAPPSQAFSPYSLAAYEAKLKILRDRARVIAPDAKPWKELTKEILKTENAIENINRRQRRGPSTQARLGAAGGAFLYGGGFSGIGSALGGIAGGLMGGVPGAFTGAAIGQAVDSMTAFTAAMTEQAVAVRRLQVGLASASTDIIDFATAVRATEDISNRLLIPIDEATRKFTQLRASTVALGLDVETTAKIFEGTTAAVLMAGGSLNDVDGAMRAVVQVFSKGKLTAEELRGQLAERLPGAVVEFAQSAGMSVQELDKAFDSGTTSIDDFVAFLRKKAEDTGGFVDKMATDSEFAGARMNKAFERLRINIGNSLQPAGAAIQDFATGAINFLDGVIRKAIDLQLIQPGANFYAQEALSGAAGGIAGLEKQIKELRAQEGALQKRAGWAAFMDANLKGVQRELKAREEGLKKIRDFEKQTKQRKDQLQSQADQEQNAKKMLDAIEGREQALADARKNYEQEIQNIRESAIKQAEALERRYQDQRLQAEREIARTRRQIAASQTEQGLLRRELVSGVSGEDPALIEQERRIGEIIRDFTEEKISLEEKAQQEQLSLSRELEDFKRQNADAINKANERYAKAIGEIQKNYAKTVAKLIEEGSGIGAKKLAAAGKLLAAQIARASAQQAFVAASGAVIIPRGTGMYEVAGQQMTEAQLLADAEQSSPATKTAAKSFVDATRQIERAQKDLSSVLGQTARVGPTATPTTSVGDIYGGVEAASAGLRGAIQGQLRAGGQLNEATILEKALGLLNQQTEEGRKRVQQIDQENRLLDEQITLIESGTLPALAEQEAIQERRLLLERNLIHDAAKQYEKQINAIQGLDEATRRRILGSISKELERQLAIVNQQATQYKQLTQYQRDLQSALRQTSLMDEAARLRSPLGQERLVELLQSGVSPAQAQAEFQTEKTNDRLRTLREGFQGLSSEINTGFADALTNIATDFENLQQHGLNFIQTLANAFKQLANTIIQEMTRAMINKAVSSLFSFAMPGVPAGPGTNFEMPNSAFVPSGGFKFANGGMVTGPTLGLIGEGRFNEAVVPLPNGKSIPVDLGGAAGSNISTNIVVNMNNGQASSQMTGSGGQALGRELEGAVRNVILKESRPGGLIYSNR